MCRKVFYFTVAPKLPVFAVDGGERAVMYDRIQGILTEPIGEGTHFKVPWLQTPHVMDIRTRPRNISSVTGTKGAFSSSSFLLSFIC